MENKVGRPEKDLSLLWDNWYDDILELYSEGASDVEIKAMICQKTNGKVRMSNSLWDRWIEDYEEFSQTIKMGKLFSESWWNKNGRKNLENKDFNYTGWYMNMKNRFGWTDKISNDITSKGEKITPPITWVDGNTE
jgi:hypothetical protein